MKKVIKCLTVNYANFSGRASRSEYWLFCLVAFITGFLLGRIDSFWGTNNVNGLLSLKSLFILAVITPSLAITARRLHDINKSGWWQSYNYVAVPFMSYCMKYDFYPTVMGFLIIGYILIFAWLCSAGTEGSNRFGADPLQA